MTAHRHLIEHDHETIGEHPHRVNDGRSSYPNQRYLPSTSVVVDLSGVEPMPTRDGAVIWDDFHFGEIRYSPADARRIAAMWLASAAAAEQEGSAT